MATYISKATGNFTASGTWSPLSTVSAAELDSEAGSTASTTSYVYSATFTPAATNVDGVAVKVAARVASPSGTISITLANNTSAGTREGTTTINVSDLDSNGNGWYFFKFGSAVSPNGTDVYKIGFKTSVTGEATLYRDSTAGNWSRMVRLTSAGSTPTTSDKLMVMGEWTAAASLTSFTVTMDETATTSYGPTVSGGPPQGLTVNKGGTLSYSTSIAAYLKLKGILAVYGGATFNIGTSGARIGSSSSAILEFDSAANVDSGLNVFPGATFNAYGNNGRTVVSTLMTADKAAAATVIVLSATTGWANSDVLCFAATTRTASECESKTISTVDSSTQVTLTAGLTNAHSGTSPTQAEVGNLTRNVKVRGVSASLQGYVVFQTTSTVVCNYVEFTQLGSATANKRGIDAQTTTGSCSITYCSIHDSTVASSVGILISGSASNNVTFSNNVTYNIASTHFIVAATTGTWTVDSNLFVRNTDAATSMASLADSGGVYTNNTSVGATAHGIAFSEAASTIGTCSGNTSHSNTSTGLVTAAAMNGGTITSLTSWRNTSFGIQVSNSASKLTFDTATLFGNGTNNIIIAGCHAISFLSVTASGDTTFSTASGVTTSAGTPATDIVFENCNFGTVTGIKTAHTQDINVAITYQTLTFRNCILASTTEVASQSNMLAGSYIRSQKHDQTAGNHKTWTKYGTISTDTTLFDITPSLRLTPNNASNKLVTDGTSVADGSGAHFVAVANGGTVTVSVKIRESVVGDGTAYNGNRARLIVRKNVAAGISADSTLATATISSNGAWETVSGTTAAVTDDAVLAFVVDCDGTTGWLNVDTWTDSGGTASRGLNYWADGEPFSVGGVGGTMILRGGIIQ